MVEIIHKYVINLREREDRRAEMMAQLHHVGWTAQFQEAKRPHTPDGFPSIGARGCYLSHLETLTRGYEMGSGHVLIMEDDLNFVGWFAHQWKRVYSELESREWSIFYPAHILEVQPEGLHEVPCSLEIRCSHFVLFNRAALETIIDGLRTILSRSPGHPLGGLMHVDGAYSTIRTQNSDLKTYVFSPSFGYQRSSRSDVADVRFFDRITIARPLLQKLRRFKNAVMHY
jgi:hypothetical protein